MHKFTVNITLVLVLFLASCNSAPIKENALVDILVDIQLLEAGNPLVHNFAELPKKKWVSDYQFVCKKHNTDTAQFKKTMIYYQKHPKEFTLVLEKVLNKLQQKEIELIQKK